MKKIYSLFFAIAAVLFSLNAHAVCTGSDNIQDGEYYSADHCKEWTQGYAWEFETTSAGVAIKVTSLDDFEGLAAAYLFDRTTGFAEHAMTLNGKTASLLLTGYNNGDQISFCIKFLVTGGDIFTKRFAYTVGDNCSAGGDANPSCSGHSTANDEHYTTYDAAATGFERGYDWKVETLPDGNVKINVEFREQWVGMTAPYLFEFHSDNTMTEHEMAWLGQTASYTLTGYHEGDEVKFLVKIAYALHVAFTERITYVVGSKCEEIQDAINEVTIDLNAPMEIFDALGRRVSGTLNDQPKGLYIIRQGGITRKIMR